MSKYRVDFTGFVYVEADSPEEALDIAQDGEGIYEEQNWEHAQEIDDFIVE